MMAFTLTGCAEPATYAEALAARGGWLAGSHTPWPASILDATPTALHPDSAVGPDDTLVSRAVVVGTFISTEPAGVHEYAPSKPRPSDTFDVYSGGVSLTLEVDEVLSVADGFTVDPTEQVLLARTGAERSVEEVAAELISLEEVVVLLDPAPHTDRTDVWTVALDWKLIGEVGESGQVTWPVLDTWNATQLDERTTVPVDVGELEELRTAR